jgi:hypothetical protein
VRRHGSRQPLPVPVAADDLRSGVDAVAENAQRAVLTYEALQRRLYDRRTRLYSETRVRWRRKPGTLWPFANTWWATCALAELPSGEARFRDDLVERLEGLFAYGRAHAGVLSGAGPIAFESRVTPPYGPGGDIYYDDNAWVGLALLRQHAITSDDRLPPLAERVFVYLVTGWSTDEHWAHSGGLGWAQPAWSKARNTCSNAPSAEVAVLLYRLTGDDSYLAWAARLYRWVRETLLRPDGLYADRIDPDGTIHEEAWSYNQGTMIGAALLLHEATGEQRYLDDARVTAQTSIDWLSRPDVMNAQGPPLFAIWLRNVLLLEERRDECLTIAESYAERTWRASGHRRDGVFVRGRDAVNPTAGMVTICSLLAGSPPHP